MPDLDAPIVAVTVHPSLARVTRRAAVPLTGGTADVVLRGLPDTLDDASLRVTGRGEVPARVVGVEVRHRREVAAPDERVAAAEAALEEARRGVGAVSDLDTAEAARSELLESVAQQGGRAFARALAGGEAEPDRLAAVADSLATALREVAGRRRVLATQRVVAERAVAAAQATLDQLRRSGRDRRDVVIAVENDGDGAVELEVDYVVAGAGWEPVYDVRVDEAVPAVELALSALLHQATGEDWPACELRVSTSQPTGAARIPEVDPWWIDRREPPVPFHLAKPAAGPAAAMVAPASERTRSAEGAAMDVALEVAVATPTDAALAATWLLPRPAAVPADGAVHRHLLESAPVEARLDHVTAPALAAEAHLRATITNSTGRALLGGTASVFLDRDFVGVAHLEPTAPGDELELALGIDDRVVVERELVGRNADKRRLGATRSTTETWSIEVTNRRDRPIQLVVRDRVPRSRHADIKVTDVRVEPEPAEHDELGRLEWTTTVAPQAAWTARVAYAIEHPKDVQVAGWR